MSNNNTRSPELVFLGTSGGIQVPAFFCDCETCETVRKDPKQRRTRASVALQGHEVVLIDAGPDIEFQLERESIRQIDRIFITHWHYDHCWGLGAFGEIPSHLTVEKWPSIQIYMPKEVAYHFDQELSYVKTNVEIYPVQPGDRIELPDATWEIVKTTHNEHSIGFIIESKQKLAYLVDGVIPPTKTIEKLANLDILILEASLDELLLNEGETWVNFSVQEAIDFWQQICTERCILTHLSCHSWIHGRLVKGFARSQRVEYESKYPGLKFAYDGMRIKLE